MNRRAVFFAAALAGLALLTPGCGKDSDSKAGPQEPPPVPVTVQTVGRAAVKRTLVLAGNVEPESEVRIYSKIAGRIEELRGDTCDELSADAMGRGDNVLAVLDHALLDAGLAQARAALAVSNAEMASAKVSLEDALRELDRAERLLKQGAINEQGYDRAKTAVAVARAGKDLAASRVVQAEAAVAAAQVNLDEASVRATIPGTITHRFVDKGDFVSPGQPLFTIQDLRTVKVLASVAQADLPLVVPGKSGARVVVEGVGQPFDAVVTKVEPALDPATLSAPIELRIENPRRVKADGSSCARWTLASGMSARVELDIQRRDDAPVVPQEAVRNDGHRDFVFVPNMETFEVDYAVAAGAGRGSLAVKSFPEQKFRGMTVKAVRVSQPMPAFVPDEKPDGVAGAKSDPANGGVKPKAEIRMGQLVSFRFEMPKDRSGEEGLVAPGEEIDFVPTGAGGAKLELLAEGLGTGREGAAPYRSARFPVRRVDVRLGSMGASPADMVRLIELLAPGDLVGKRVVMQGVSRLTDGAMVQLIEGPSPKAEAATARPPEPAPEGQPR